MGMKVDFLTHDAALPFPTSNAPLLPYSLYPTSFPPPSLLHCSSYNPSPLSLYTTSFTPPSLLHCYSYNPSPLLLISHILHPSVPSSLFLIQPFSPTPYIPLLFTLYPFLFPYSSRPSITPSSSHPTSFPSSVIFQFLFKSYSS